MTLSTVPEQDILSNKEHDKPETTSATAMSTSSTSSSLPSLTTIATSSSGISPFVSSDVVEFFAKLRELFITSAQEKEKEREREGRAANGGEVNDEKEGKNGEGKESKEGGTKQAGGKEKNVQPSITDPILRQQMADVKAMFESGDIIDYIWAFGPKHNGPNLLINRTQSLAYFSSITASLHIPSRWDEATRLLSKQNIGITQKEKDKLENALLFSTSVEYSLDQGFQSAANNGAICGEPLMGVCFVVDQIKATEYDTAARGPDPYGPMAGQLMAVIRKACQLGLARKGQRLMEAFFLVELQCVADVIGKLCGVINKRRGRIISDGDPIEGTNYYTIKALLPVHSSFGFASGKLIFSLCYVSVCMYKYV